MRERERERRKERERARAGGVVLVRAVGVGWSGHVWYCMVWSSMVVV